MLIVITLIVFVLYLIGQAIRWVTTGELCWSRPVVQSYKSGEMKAGVGNSLGYVRQSTRTAGPHGGASCVQASK